MSNDIDAIFTDEIGDIAIRFGEDSDLLVVEQEKLNENTIRNYICREILLSLLKNIKEDTNKKSHTCEISPAILGNINFLKERGFDFSYPKEGDKILELDDIANLKAEIASHLEVIHMQNPDLPEKIEEIDEHEIIPVEKTAKSPINLFNNEAKKKTQKKEKQGVNLAHELLHKAGLPALQNLEEKIRNQAAEVEDINKCREALLVIKRHMAKSFDEESKSHPIDAAILEKLAFLEEMGIKLIEIKEGQREFSLTELLELKEQIASQVSKLQLEQQTLFTTKINPTLNDRHIIMEILKMCLRIESQMMNALIQNQKTN